MCRESTVQKHTICVEILFTFYKSVLFYCTVTDRKPSSTKLSLPEHISYFNHQKSAVLLPRQHPAGQKTCETAKLLSSRRWDAYVHDFKPYYECMHAKRPIRRHTFLNQHLLLPRVQGNTERRARFVILDHLQKPQETSTGQIPTFLSHSRYSAYRIFKCECFIDFTNKE